MVYIVTFRVGEQVTACMGLCFVYMYAFAVTVYVVVYVRVCRYVSMYV